MGMGIYLEDILLFLIEHQIYLIECVDFVHFPIEEAGGENAKQKKILKTQIFLVHSSLRSK